MRVLAIDTSGDACSAALLAGDRVEQLFEPTPRRHGELILPMMQQLLDQAGLRLRDLDALAFGRGPGSFTGVRIATAVIQGTAFGAGLPVVPVSTLAAIALGQFRRGGQQRLLTALDARMGEVYWGCFEVNSDGLVEPRGAEQVCSPGRIERPPGTGWFGVGPGWAVHGETLTARLGAGLDGTFPDGVCEAQDIARIAITDLAAGHQVSPELASPVYLRDQVVHLNRAPE